MENAASGKVPFFIGQEVLMLRAPHVGRTAFIAWQPSSCDDSNKVRVRFDHPDSLEGATVLADDVRTKDAHSDAVRLGPKRRFAALDPEEANAAVSNCVEVRVINASSGVYKRVGRVVALPSAADAIVSVGGNDFQERRELLEVMPSGSSGNVVAAAQVAVEELKAQSYQARDVVSIVGGEHHGYFRDAYVVVRPLLDDRYLVSLPDKGHVPFRGVDLTLARANPFQSVGRPRGDLPVPVAVAGGPPSDCQLAFLRAACAGRNVDLHGEPGSGKTTCCVAYVKAVSLSYSVLTLAVSNSIRDEIERRLYSAGVAKWDKLVETLASGFWASLGEEFRWDRLDAIVDEILTGKHTKHVRHRIWEAHVIVFEEASMMLPYVKDLIAGPDGLISRVCSYKGPEPAAGKQIIIVDDLRQLGGIQVEDGLAKGVGISNYGLTPLFYGDRTVVGEPKCAFSNESQMLQPFYPHMPVVVRSAHWCEDGATDVSGIVLHFCHLRNAFVVTLADRRGREPWVDAWASDASGAKLRYVEFVRCEHLERGAVVDSRSVFLHVHLTNGSHRLVADVPYDSGVPAAEQSPRTVFAQAVADMHKGRVDSSASQELVKRAMHVGPRMLSEGAEGWYEKAFHIFTMNVCLEKFAVQHVQTFKVSERHQELARLLPDEQRGVKELFAVKLDADGHAQSSSSQDWDKRDSDRQRVSGSTACYLRASIGYPLMVGTFPQQRNPNKERISYAIAVGKNKEHGKLKPGKVVVPIFFNCVKSHIPNLEYEYHITVECVDYAKGPPYPTAIIKPFEYESQMVEGVRLRWYALPLKFLKLRTINSLQSKGLPIVICHFNYIWLFHQFFTAITRATHPPPRVGETLAGLNGCIGIVDVGYAIGDEFKHFCVVNGIHPKVALEFATVEGHGVPERILIEARKWLALHTNFHLKQEQLELAAALAAQHVASRAEAPGLYDA